VGQITLRDLTKRFGAVTAVERLSLEIAEGEMVTLVGGSGCGKTTTLRMIAGFETPDAGDVVVDGRMMNPVPPQRRGIGIVFQSYALFPTMRVWENVAFGLRVARWPEAKVRERVKELLDLVKLTGMEGRYPHQLSGGQQQRVALARALARKPGILLLDEPLSALDAKIRASLRTEIRKIQQEVGITTVYVTHDQEEALSISDRIVVMRDGRIEQAGRPVEIYARPLTRFVADFIGVSNLLECRVISPEEGRVTWQDHALKVGGPLRGAAGERVWISVRPEKLTLYIDPAQVPGGANRLAGQVEVVTFLGATVRLEVSVNGHPVWVDLSAERGGFLERNAAVALAFAPADCIVIPDA
jgi:ABC-type Fe3+/spermidine/putrescine transport system ATPase subunit